MRSSVLFSALLCAALLCILSSPLTAQSSSTISTPKNSPEQLLQKETESLANLSTEQLGRLIERTQQVALLQQTIGGFGLSLTAYSTLLDISGRSVVILQAALLETSNSLGESKRALSDQQRLQKLSQQADDAVQADLEASVAGLKLENTVLKIGGTVLLIGAADLAVKAFTGKDVVEWLITLIRGD